MTLSFSQQINGKPNYFLQKIWTSLMPVSLSNQQLYKVLSEFWNYTKAFEAKFEKSFEIVDVKPKLHTIRLGNRWQAGKLIHPVINNRTPNRFQFAPTIKCVSVQEIEIFHCTYHGEFYGLNIGSWLRVDNFFLPDKIIEKLAINDGFDNVEDFFAYFNKDFKGQIIHWTDLRY